MAKKSTSIQKLTISGSAVPLHRVEAALREAESALAESGKLAAGATLLRADLNQRGNVTSICFEGDDGLYREVANRLRKGRSKLKVSATTVRAATSLLE